MNDGLASVPDRIGPYRVLGRLGAGGMATVYRAEQATLKRPVALKVVSPQFAGDPAFRDRFLREAQASARISHPNVITCFDAGDDGGLVWMALELVTGGDLLGLLERRGGKLDEALTLALLRDCCAGLEAIESAKLIHRDIKPANVFLTERGQAKLADLGLARQSDKDSSRAGVIMGTPAYIAPEQARGEVDLDIRADLFALGATLFHLMAGHPPYEADTPLNTLVKVLNDDVPELKAERPDASPGLLAVLGRMLAKDRAVRYPSPCQAREDFELLIAGRPPRHAKIADEKRTAKTARQDPPSSRGERASTPADGTSKADPRPPTPAAGPRVDKAQLAALTKRILVDKDGLKASLVLAPGASFPRFLLEQILDAAGIRYGIDQGAVHEATRPTEHPRRIVLARGEAPTPGMNGRGVRGDELMPLDRPVIIRVADDGMQAVAFTALGARVPQAALEETLRESGLRFGIIPSAIKRLVDGPAEPDGRCILARGTPMDPGRNAGFCLGRGVANTTVEALAVVNNLTRVSAGSQLAVWQEGQTGQTGRDVYGRPIPVPPPPTLKPDEFAGEGTELGRDRDGCLVLRATRNGYCQQQSDGAIRVVGVHEVDGDVGPDSPAIDTDDVVVVRGSVLSGAQITSSSDVVVLGDLHDAEVNAGGTVQVDGSIAAGDRPVCAAGGVVAQAIGIRAVMAGSVRITGEARNSRILATGDVQVGRVVGGSLIAGGNLHADIAGDRDGTTTEMWAGRNMAYDQQAKLAKLAERRVEAERQRLVVDVTRMQAEMLDENQRHQRLTSARYARSENLERVQARLKQLEEGFTSKKAQAEAARHELIKVKEQTRKAERLSDNEHAKVWVSVVAHAGVIARIADAEPDMLQAPQLQYQLGG